MAYESPLLRRPGVVAPPEDHPEAGVPWHWGDPFAEQRTASRGVAVVDRSHREIITVTGEDRLSWLHLVISQHVTELPEGEGTEALVLDSHGRIDAHMVLAYVDGTVYLDTDPGAQATTALPKGGEKQPLLDYFEAMKFWSKVDIRDATDEWALLTLLGPEVSTMLSRFDIELDTRPYAVTRFSGGIARRMPWPGPSSVDLLIPRSELVDWWTKLTDAGARPAGTWAFDALRVESLRPKLGVDTDERTIPHEVNWIGSAAHVAKGCYRGQETVAKVHNVGKPPRNMVLLHLDGSQEIYPETGDPVLRGDRTVGRVGSVAQHHELGPIALALLKRSTPADAELLAGTEDRVVQASIDPDSLPREHTAPGREAARRLRG
ncbi:YgfZ/GcvT domain-containing protein [Saccharomonospora viridis]|jgi:folate-binding protein YgfZ|uniref:Folate-binding protein YgfZ n=1 Tax=Saccharomonospora viridis (strain ATCC 15386 / DSM 43017 / JCM 3036 / CCUG 5913 / NBRC 12207 / NCIMB 9602 / P101) TaxID=471857 RepID=C7MRD3_SACVD|nr:folate-binding protein YgfZ [Saccharomonospora viridis]ACU98719.1 folate-binding protein YgfZ [Saccharomonospora viridis DSM 43017]